MAVMHAVLSSLQTNLTGRARDASIWARIGITSRMRPEPFAPTKHHVSESAVEPLVWVAFLVEKQIGPLRFPQGEESSNQNPPEAFVE